MTARAEQETTVSAGRDESVVRIWSNNPVHVRRLRKDPRATQLDGDDMGGHFTIPADQFDPLKGFKRARRAMTEEQRAAAAERLSNARKAKA